MREARGRKLLSLSLGILVVVGFLSLFFFFLTASPGPKECGFKLGLWQQKQSTFYNSQSYKKQLYISITAGSFCLSVLQVTAGPVLSCAEPLQQWVKCWAAQSKASRAAQLCVLTAPGPGGMPSTAWAALGIVNLHAGKNWVIAPCKGF